MNKANIVVKDNFLIISRSSYFAKTSISTKKYLTASRSFGRSVSLISQKRRPSNIRSYTFSITASFEDHEQEHECKSASRRQLIVQVASGAVALASMGFLPAGGPSSAMAAVEPFCGAFEGQTLPQYVYSLPWEEKSVKFDGGETWCRVVGNKKAEKKEGKLPVLCIHGGPGISARYLEPLELLASTGHRVVLYDQSGCGYSTPGTSKPSMELFMDEIDAVRKACGMQDKKVHIFGQGWGGMLALNYVLSDPVRSSSVASLALASTSASLARLVEDRTINLQTLDPATQELLADANPETRLTSAYTEAQRAYARRFTSFRLPQCLSLSWNAPVFAGSVEQALVGAHPYTQEGGSLIGWNVEDRLSSINTPVFLTRGASDEISKNTTELLRSKLPNVKVQTFSGASCSQIDDWEIFLESLDNFVNSVERKKL